MKRIQNRKIKTHHAQMTCDVEHTMVKSKALSNPRNPLQILGSSAGKNQFSSEKTYSCKLTKKKATTSARESRRLVSLYLHDKF